MKCAYCRYGTIYSLFPSNCSNCSHEKVLGFESRDKRWKWSGLLSSHLKSQSTWIAAQTHGVVCEEKTLHCVNTPKGLRCKVMCCLSLLAQAAKDLSAPDLPLCPHAAGILSFLLRGQLESRYFLPGISSNSYFCFLYWAGQSIYLQACTHIHILKLTHTITMLI